VYVARVAVSLVFDESGNLDFGPKGTRYFCVGTLATRDPAALERAPGALRYDLLAEGVELEAFHATEDRQAVRDRVFAALTAAGGFEVGALVVDKAGVPEALREEARFYPECAERLLARVFARYPDPGERVVVVTNRPPLERTKQAVEKAFKLFIRRRLGARPLGVLHHASAAHAALHAADYALWAVYRTWRGGDARSHALVAPHLRSERLTDLADPAGDG
jgi:hypothetical protein